ncbi:MAG TPA: ATP-binding cassette domain-containing protein [Alloiococcus sp.]|nr:ATP-binding cassette domain-containing protein [Alloiococcus sp.]
MKSPILKLNNLHYEVENKKIIEDINFTVDKGEIVTIIGPSGSGKSTLLKLVGSLILPTKGEVLYAGKNIYDIKMTEYRQEVSYFFQNALLFGETVEDNLRYPYEIRSETFNQTKAEEMLENLQLDKSILTKSINSISGGEKQRVALVRNLLYQPKVLLLDEITSSLDAQNRTIVKDHLKRLQSQDDITVLMVTHNEKEIDHADRIIEVINGRIEN